MAIKRRANKRYCMNYLRKLLLCLVLFALVFNSNAQQQNKTLYPEVGLKFPDFILPDVKHFRQTSVTLDDFKGKWLIVEFFSKNCIPCFKSFPKLNELQKDFSSEVQFLLIGMNGDKYSEGLENLYEKFRQKYSLELPVSFDSILAKRVGVHFSGQISIIDPYGIVRFVGSSYELTKDNLSDLIQGNKSAFSESTWDVSEKSIDSIWKIPNRDNPAVLFSSLFGTHEINTLKNSSESIEVDLSNGYVREIGLGALDLYKHAYFGRNHLEFTDSIYSSTYVNPILEVKNASTFGADYKTNKNLFNYTLTAHRDKVSKVLFMTFMQTDLDRYLGFQSRFADRMVECWELVIFDPAKLRYKNNGKPNVSRVDIAGLVADKISIERLLFCIAYYNVDQPNFFDNTNIQGTIFIKLDAIMNDLPDVRKALQSNGLDLIKSKRMMKVLVIHDPRPEPASK